MTRRQRLGESRAPIRPDVMPHQARRVGAQLRRTRVLEEAGCGDGWVGVTRAVLAVQCPIQHLSLHIVDMPVIDIDVYEYVTIHRDPAQVVTGAAGRVLAGGALSVTGIHERHTRICRGCEKTIPAGGEL